MKPQPRGVLSDDPDITFVEKYHRFLARGPKKFTPANGFGRVARRIPKDQWASYMTSLQIAKAKQQQQWRESRLRSQPHT